jgi:hypothetical protein
MSIARTAPQKFDFQDIVCIEMMLRFAHVPEARFFVEPPNGEDGELHLVPSTSALDAEIQVKGARVPSARREPIGGRGVEPA